MNRLQIVVPPSLTAQVSALLTDTPTVTNIIHHRGAGYRPDGDVLVCNVADEAVSSVVADLRDLEIDHDGSIVIGPDETVLSASVAAAERAASGSPSDAVVWEKVEEHTAESAELSASFITFMITAALIAAVGIYHDSPILIIGAMIVCPDFGPIAGLCVAVIERRPSEASRSLLALFVGYALGIVAVFLVTAILHEVDLVSGQFGPASQSMASSITTPGFLTVLVALLAGVAGMLSLTTAKSGPLIGVLVSVTTIPAVAEIAIAGAFSQWTRFGGAVLQLETNLGAMFFAGIVTLAVERVFYQHQRAANLQIISRQEKK